MYLGTRKFLSKGQVKKFHWLQKNIPPNELFENILKLLEEYPYHSFMARWQKEQMDNLIEHLPLDEVVWVHDYSQGYSCRQQDELKSAHFGVVLLKFSLHITILYHHAVQSIYGMRRIEADPNVIKEHLSQMLKNGTSKFSLPFSKFLSENCSIYSFLRYLLQVCSANHHVEGDLFHVKRSNFPIHPCYLVSDLTL